MSAPRLVTLITGANRGLGFELARALVRLGGFHVIAAARKWENSVAKPQGLLQTAHREATKMPTRHLSELSFVELDVTSPRSRLELEGSLASVLGTDQRVNVLVNNAGIYPDGWDAETFARCMATNAIGPLRLAEELAPFYSSDAHVINVTSGYGKTRFLSDGYKAAIAGAESIADLESRVRFDAADAAMKGASVPCYKVSKAALNRGTQILASRSLKGVARVTAVEPGWCKTEMGGKDAPRTAGEGARSIYAMIVGDGRLIGSGKFYDSAGSETSWE